MQYERIKYPDGQISVKIKEHTGTICERINSYEDLFFVRSIVESLNQLGVNYPCLFIPCMFGQRSDRRFADNQSFDLKLVAEVINNCKFRSVTIFDPHSDVTLALINNSTKISPIKFVKKTIDDINSNELVLVSPDAGAYKKVFEFGKELNMPVVAANKYRDKEGKINLVFVGDVLDKDCLIVDDMCDGGYTFYLLSKALRKQGAKRVFLYISHGYFSKHFKTPLEETDPNSTLQKCLDGIFCTNSVKDISNTYFDGYNTKTLGNLITQYKIV